MMKRTYLLLFLTLLYSGVSVGATSISSQTSSNEMSNSQPAKVPNEQALTLTANQVQKLSQLFKSDKIDATAQAAIQSALPLMPAQIQAYKQRKAEVDKVTVAAPISSSQLESTIRSINLTNSVVPPLLHLASNYATNISFVGENGKPWPIENIVPGNEKIITANFSSEKDPYNSSLLVQIPWASSNISFYLKGRVKPVILFVHTAPDTSQGLDAAVNVTLDGVSPGTAPLAVKNVGAVSDALLNTVDYAPGSDWKPVKLSRDNLPVGIKMWVSPDNHLAIVRISSGQLVSPDWTSQASNQDNTVTAYAFNTVPLMLLVNSNDGQSFQVSVKQAVETLASIDKDLTKETSVEITNISAIEKQARTRFNHVN